jgi:hypothetical protein
MTLGPMCYQGRLWDAPAFDDAEEVVVAGTSCVLCQEMILEEDNACITPVGQSFHLECWLRPVFGSIAHLEGRCSCSGGDGDEYDEEVTYRDDARAVLQWLIDNQRGRFAA